MNPSLLNDDVLKPYRDDFPHLSQPHYYLNHAAFGVLSRSVVRHIHEHLENRSSGEIETFPSAFDVIEETRGKIARMINAPSPDNIAFITNTSDGLNLVASGLKWKAGDGILLNDLEFPANVYPWKNQEQYGAEVRFAKSHDGAITTSEIASALRENDRVLSISAVQFLSGYKSDLKALGELSRKNDSWFVVDAIQAFGNCELDVQAMQIDALVSGSHKWMMGPMGSGFIYLSDALIDELQMSRLGWLSVENPWDLFNYDQQLNNGARRFEMGGINISAIFGLHKSLDPMLELGGLRINEHLLYLTDLIHELMEQYRLKRYTPPAHESRTGIITYDLPGHTDGDALVNELKRVGVTIAYRNKKLRFSPHYYNTDGDIRNMMEIADPILSKRLRKSPGTEKS